MAKCNQLTPLPCKELIQDNSELLLLELRCVWRCLAGQSDTNTPWWRTVINWICGIEKQLEPTAEQKAEMTYKQTSLDEVPLYRRLCDVNAIALMGVAVFFWAFFA